MKIHLVNSQEEGLIYCDTHDGTTVYATLSREAATEIARILNERDRNIPIQYNEKGKCLPFVHLHYVIQTVDCA